MPTWLSLASEAHGRLELPSVIPAAHGGPHDFSELGASVAAVHVEPPVAGLSIHGLADPGQLPFDTLRAVERFYPLEAPEGIGHLERLAVEVPAMLVVRSSRTSSMRYRWTPASA
jgi:hypothetical protein